jgi:hypothetical protein
MNKITSSARIAFERMMMDRTCNKPFDPVLKDIDGKPVDANYIKRVSKAVDQACDAERNVDIDVLEAYARENQ